MKEALLKKKSTFYDFTYKVLEQAKPTYGRRIRKLWLPLWDEEKEPAEKRHEGIFQGDSNVLYLDRSLDYMGTGVTWVHALVNINWKKWKWILSVVPDSLQPYSPPGSFSVHEVFQARILEWVAIFFSRGSSRPRDQTQVSHTAGRLFTLWAMREYHIKIDFCKWLKELNETGLNPGILHCRWILYQLSHKGSPRILEWVAYPFSSGSSQPGIEPGSPALQADSLPTELSLLYTFYIKRKNQTNTDLYLMIYIRKHLKENVLSITYSETHPKK